MDALSISAASGMRARMESLEMLANNIANQATAGYKTDREFYSLYQAPEAVEGAGGVNALLAPTLPVIERAWTDFSQGTLAPTGNPLDLALSGRGFFMVRGPDGPLYTRNGSFHLSTNGILETWQGYPVLDNSQAPIQLDPTLAVEVSAKGAVLQDGEPVAELGVVEFTQPHVLRKHFGTYFRTAGTQLRPTNAQEVEVRQGALESANATPAESAVRLIGVMRQFEMLERAMRLGSEMNRRAIEEVARVGQ